MSIGILILKLKRGYKKTLYQKLGKYIILDEYDREVSYDELISTIDKKQSDPFNYQNPDNFKYCDNVDGYRFSKGYFS